MELKVKILLNHSRYEIIQFFHFHIYQYFLYLFIQNPWFHMVLASTTQNIH